VGGRAARSLQQEDRGQAPVEAGVVAGVVTHSLVVFTLGAVSPAMSVSWAPPIGAIDSGYIVIYSDHIDVLDEAPTTVCMRCLVDDGDEQLARGLDLARQHGQVDWDVEAGEWFVPVDAAVSSG
jgi:hypothetical protein